MSCDRCGQIHNRCTAHNRAGDPCGNRPIEAGSVCYHHGAAAPQVIQAARRRAATMEAHAKAERMLAGAGVDADPIEHLVDSLYRAAALVEVWGQMVADLDNAAEVDLRDRPGGMRGEMWYETVTYDVENADGEVETHHRRVPKADRLLALNREGLIVTHPFVDEYQRALERKAKFAKLALDAGVEERQVRATEAQVDLAQQAFEAGLDAAGVTGDQRQEARKAHARHLRAV